MELGEALERIDAIRAHVARAGVFRGYRAATVGCTGLLAFLASAVQPLVVPDPAENVHPYLQLWIGVAAISAICVGIELDPALREVQIPLATGTDAAGGREFCPLSGGRRECDLGVVQFSPGAIHLLPGLWAILFSVGIFASCRQMPRLIVVVGIHYLAAGVACLALARNAYALSPWAMAATFGVGQLLTAAVLYLALERHHADC